MIHELLQITGSHKVVSTLIVPKDTGSAQTVTGSVAHQNGEIFIFNGQNWQTLGAQSGITQPDTSLEYMVIAGGGGGGGWGGGGGAGGLLSGSIDTVTSGSSFTMTVGAGSAGGQLSQTAGGYVQGVDGTNSSLAGSGYTTVTATGGGGGGRHNSYTPDNGRDGGSGGGAGMHASNNNVVGGGSGGSGTTGQGNDGGGGGGSSSGNSVYYRGGGGGGASQVGQDGTGHNSGGQGGSGSLSTITGTSVRYAGGGGSHTDRRSGATVAPGGPGGGGAGGGYQPDTHAVDGTANTGGGGGGSYGYSNSHQGGGGSGVIIVAYDSGSFNGAGGIVGPGSGGKRSHTFLSSDTFKIGATTDFQIVTDSLQVHLDAGNFSSRGDSTWTDLTGNGHNATLTNGPVLNNFYYEFDGSNDSARFAQSSDMVSTTNMSIEMWVAVGSIGSKFTQLVINRSSTAGDYSTTMSIGIDNRQVVRTWNSSGNDTMVLFVHVGNNAGNAASYAWSKNKFGTSNGDGNFHHVVGTFSDGYLKLYYDGSLVNTNSSAPSSIWAGDSYFRIAGEYSPGGTTYNLLANVAQVRFYKKTLSDAEVLQNYNATKTNFV